ncbi:sodium:calcium antiporter, partial [Chloroflexota bacterium]
MKNWLWLVSAALLTVPALSFRFGGIEAGVGTETVFFGVAIVGAAFLITWAAEVAEMDISQSLALALIALIAVLPEYSVDLYFAWTAAKNPEYAHYAIANMTGANRLLIGLGWTLVLFLFWFKTKKTTLVLDGTHKIEFF